MRKLCDPDKVIKDAVPGRNMAMYAAVKGPNISTINQRVRRDRGWRDWQAFLARSRGQVSCRRSNGDQWEFIEAPRPGLVQVLGIIDKLIAMTRTYALANYINSVSFLVTLKTDEIGVRRSVGTNFA